MRRNILALGILIMLLAFVLQVSSQFSVVIDPARDTWVTVNSNEANPPVLELSVSANLSKDERFRIFFSLQRISGSYLPDGFGLDMNLTDPNGAVLSFERDAEIGEDGKIVITNLGETYPSALANVTGTYRADAQSRGGVIMVRLLTIEKSVTIPANVDYPWTILSPASIVVFVAGTCLLFLGAVSSKARRPRKSRLPKANKR
jgi:hypothetical protein